MLTDAGIETMDEHRIVLHKNGKKLTLLVTDTAGITMKTWKTDPPPHDYDAPNPGTVLVGFELNLPANTHRAIDVLLLPEKSFTAAQQPVKPLGQWPNSLH
jgi:hypothetical protein